MEYIAEGSKKRVEKGLRKSNIEFEIEGNVIKVDKDDVTRAEATLFRLGVKEYKVDKI